MQAEEARGLCTWCPSLCRHACPVATIEGDDTLSPWGLMSSLEHAARGRMRGAGELARRLYACTGCGGCTEACVHRVDVAGEVFAARARNVARGRIAFERPRFRREEPPGDSFWTSGIGRVVRTKREPQVLLVPGHRSLLDDATAVRILLGLCERIDQGELSLGDASLLDLGYDLWAGGMTLEFRSRAHSVRRILDASELVVVMSAEGLHLLRTLYVEHGFPLRADVLHVSEFLGPLLHGKLIAPVGGRVGLHASCHLSRHLGISDLPLQILERCVASPIVELRDGELETFCCGGTGCLPLTHPETSAAMADEVIERATARGIDRLVTFASECVAPLAAAAERQAAVAGRSRLRVDDALALIDEAVRGEVP